MHPEGAATLDVACAPAAPVPAAADGDYGWGLLLRSLSDILQHDKRPALGEATLAVLFHLLATYSASWDEAAWRVLLHRVVKHILALPPLPPEATAPEERPASAAHSRTGSLSSMKQLQEGAGAQGQGAQGGQAAAVPVPGVPEEAALQGLLLRMEQALPVLAKQLGTVRADLQVRL
jgi:hypothetical protein